MFTSLGFSDWEAAEQRLERLAPDAASREPLEAFLPVLLAVLSDAPVPDGALVNFERFVQSVPDRALLFRFLAENPRAVEILFKLFIGSQYLTEILLRSPEYLERLTRHRRLADFKSRQDFLQDTDEAASRQAGFAAKLDALRRVQQWELLRIGACDAFGLMDLKGTTVQLSLLADSLVQSCLNLVAAELNVSPRDMAVLAFGKLGGEELNYSSDVDLVFVSTGNPSVFWVLGQRLIRALQDTTAEGFLYRVDMRLRPWGRSGPLVTSVDSYIEYLADHAQPWEKQALLKARRIAGNLEIGEELLRRAEPLIFSEPADGVRQNVREMKERIEAGLDRRGRKWGEVKLGTGSIRDVEFVTQYLQLVHGGENPAVRSINTLDGLVRLAEFGHLPADEYRHLTSGYLFLRGVEHALQLLHHNQTHSLPQDPRELNYLARRLDYRDGDHFLAHYERHCAAIRAVYDRHLGQQCSAAEIAVYGDESIAVHVAEPEYREAFSPGEIKRHNELLSRISDDNLVEVDAVPREDGSWRVTVAGVDHPGDLSMSCGLFFIYGLDILDGDVFTDEQRAGANDATPRGGTPEPARRSVAPPMFVNVFTVRPTSGRASSDTWGRYRADLAELLRLVEQKRFREAQGKVARRVAEALQDLSDGRAPLSPVEVQIDNSASETATVVEIRAEDTLGFLYELTNALALTGTNIVRVIIRSDGRRVHDTLFITDATGSKITEADRQQELRAAIVLIKHFTHLLPRSPNPEAALLHFREFLERLYEQPNWPAELSSLERPEVLEALAKLLGVSDFLWEDFLRLQYANLLPVVKDLEGLAERKERPALQAELDRELESAGTPAERRDVLNAFKDREMFRIDMRHILGRIPEFGQFSTELTDMAEVIVETAWRICDSELRGRFGAPCLDGSRACPLAICALGKCGGRELGFASDIELMFVYEDLGQTTGPEIVSTTEYYLKLVEAFIESIRAKREGIFRVDLRLRPYGRAGSLAVSLDAFRAYFGPDGPAWPYERQALVKLRPIAGEEAFGRRIAALRDELLYTGEPFDAASMRAMREKQIRQLVKGGTVHAKLSPGGLADCEYLVQGLQITWGHTDPALRATRTRTAMAALRHAGILSPDDYATLSEAYIFLRRLIDALRMVRGDARDLTVPPSGSEEFSFLARRLGYGSETRGLLADLERHTAKVRELARLLDR